jgi:hypothetical protein
MSEFFKNIKSNIAGIDQVPGNEVISEIEIKVEIIYIDGAGLEIVPAALPVELQTLIPVYLFGLTDWQGGYLNGHRVLPSFQPWNFNPFNKGINNYNGFVHPNAAILVTHGFNSGDLVYDLFANVPAGFFNAIVMIRCNNVSYGTLIQSLVSDLISINRLKYFAPVNNINQFINPLKFCYQTLFGAVATDTIDPRLFQLGTDFQNNISDIPVKFKIDKNLLLCYYQNFDCQITEFIFYVNKVEALTLRKKYKI